MHVGRVLRRVLPRSLPRIALRARLLFASSACAFFALPLLHSVCLGSALDAFELDFEATFAAFLIVNCVASGFGVVEFCVRICRVAFLALGMFSIVFACISLRFGGGFCRVAYRALRCERVVYVAIREHRNSR